MGCSCRCGAHSFQCISTSSEAYNVLRVIRLAGYVVPVFTPRTTALRARKPGHFPKWLTKRGEANIFFNPELVGSELESEFFHFSEGKKRKRVKKQKLQQRKRQKKTDRLHGLPTTHAVEPGRGSTPVPWSRAVTTAPRPCHGTAVATGSTVRRRSSTCFRSLLY